MNDFVNSSKSLTIFYFLAFSKIVLPHLTLQAFPQHTPVDLDGFASSLFGKALIHECDTHSGATSQYPRRRPCLEKSAFPDGR
jgi:hypothetical protein